MYIFISLEDHKNLNYEIIQASKYVRELLSTLMGVLKKRTYKGKKGQSAHSPNEISEEKSWIDASFSLGLVFFEYVHETYIPT